MPAHIEPGPRTAKRVQSVSPLVFDVEAKAKTVDGEKKIIGPEPPSFDAMLDEIKLSGLRCIVHSTHSHTPEHPRYRIVFDVSRPLAVTEVRALGLHVAAMLGIGDCIDTSCLEPARLLFLPRCPAARHALFRHAETKGEALAVDALLAEAAKINEAIKSAAKPRETGKQSGGVIEAFNAAHDVGAILEQHGYQPRRGNRWLWPGSTSGIPGVRLLPDSNPQRVYSSHGGDPLSDRHGHDAFDLFRILEHDGDNSAAVKAAGQMMGTGWPRAMNARRRPLGDAHEQHTGNESAPVGDSDTAWPEPEPLAVKVKAEPYPIDALPEIIRKAVEEVAAFVKAPLPLVVASALATLSLAIQATVDAQRADKLSGPVALFLLTIADSGERKSTCDEFFTKPIREYEQAQAEAAKPHQKKYAAEFAAWKAEGEGIISAIREAAKGKRKGKSIDTLQAELIELENLKPEPLRVPKLMRGDDTPENLAWALATQWPSAGVVFAEAGLVLGSHGMGNDSIMRNLALLNILWDGGELSIGRRTSESFTVRGARFTLGLQVQEATLRSFFEKSGKLARGIGFFARFLVAWPESTQGLRPFTEAPKDWPHLAAFHKRIDAILDQTVPIDANGALTPLMLPMTADAKAAWVDYHDAIEGELASGGELYDVRDVASKSADNAARLAALFQRFDGDGDAIGADALQNASRITAWHLNEARRFFGELALPDELANAARLDSWLFEYCRRVRTHLVGKNHARQHGPLRDGVVLDTAIRELADLDRVRLVKDGKRLTIHVNPQLLGFAAAVIDAGQDRKTA